MERQARFLLMGLFVLAFFAAMFASVYWLHGFGHLGATAVYAVRFEGGAPGIAVGGSVLFDGVRVGEITKVAFDPADPNQVVATIVVDDKTPVRADTQVGVDTLGLMGGGAISLHGGGVNSPAPTGVGGAPPVLTADPMLVLGLQETARQVVQRLDKVLADNAEPLRSTLSNLDVFTNALSRNAGRVDSILQGLDRMVGGAQPKAPAPIYDLAAPTSFPPLKKSTESLTVPDPTAVVMYDSQRALVRNKDGAFTFLENAQWSDSLDKLIQAKLIEACENAEAFASVGRPVEGGPPDNQLLLDIRSFAISSAPSPSADVAIGAKLVSADGKVIAERVFQRSVPVATIVAPEAISALSDAFLGVEKDLVAWASGSL